MEEARSWSSQFIDGGIVGQEDSAREFVELEVVESEVAV